MNLIKLTQSFTSRVLALCLLAACSNAKSSSGNANVGGSAGESSTGSGGSAGNAGGGSAAGEGTGGSALPSAELGRFTVALHPAVEGASPYTSVSGVVRVNAYPTDVIATLKRGDSNCAVYALTLQSCAPACSTTQVCVATDTCLDIPKMASVGDVTVAGIGASNLLLSQVNNQYQYAGDIDYPGFGEGEPITLKATGGELGSFNISAAGVAPLELDSNTYTLDPGSPVLITWNAAVAPANSRVAFMLNLSHHIGTRGYLKCEVADSGSLTIPADQVKELIDLGVAGYPTFTATRTSTGQAAVGSGVVLLVVTAGARPELKVSGFDSCVADDNCPASKPYCDSVTKLCHS